MLHRAQALAACTAGRRVLAVAGANGKDNETNLKYGAGLQYDLTPTDVVNAIR